MSQQLSRREIRLLVALPAVLIVCVYAFFFDRPRRGVIGDIQQATAAARQSAVREDQLRAKKEEISLLTEQGKLEQRRAAAATRPSLILPARWTTLSGRLDAMALIGEIFDSHALFIVSTSRLADATSNAMVPKKLQEFAAAVSHEGQSPVPDVWRVDVLGSYADLLAALRELDRGNTFIVPVGVSMDPIGGETNYRRWSIWFWV